MRISSTFDANRTLERERESVTHIYFKPPTESEALPLSYPIVRSFEVSDDRFTMPTFRPNATRISRTHAIRRPTAPSYLRIAFAAACVLFGIMIGGLIAFGGHSNSKAEAAPLATPAAKPMAVKPVVAPAPKHVAVAPVPAATVTPAPPATPPVTQPTLATVRVETQPAGATAMLVDDGKTTLIGTTPVDAQLDRTREYDVILTLEDHETHIEHLDPSSNQHVMVVLAAEEAPAPAPTPAPVHHHHNNPKKVEHTVVAEKQAATGSLKVSSKPSCSIVIDGKTTGMTTPQASIALAVGHHDVTLVNAEEGIHLTTEVEISADHATQLVQDFTK